LDAAELAKLNVLSLINQGTAVALHWGLERTKDFDLENETLAVFIDMGHSYTSANLVSFKAVEEAGKKTKLKDKQQFWQLHGTNILDQGILTKKLSNFF